jgi:hypothetical protein
MKNIITEAQRDEFLSELHRIFKLNGMEGYLADGNDLRFFTLARLLTEFNSHTNLTAITDIKGVYKAPIWWWGILRWVLVALVLCGVSVAIYYLIAYVQRRKQEEMLDVVNTEPLRPADEVAIEKLDIIREKKIWQQGQLKEYYTQLTDVVREYIDRRFEVSSAEQTSDETLRAMRPLLNERKDLYEDLRKMLTLADLVKFAKWSTTPDENELSLRSAYKLVKETTTEEEKEQ